MLNTLKVFISKLEISDYFALSRLLLTKSLSIAECVLSNDWGKFSFLLIITTLQVGGLIRRVSKRKVP